MPVGTYALTSLINLKSYLNISVETYDTLLENLIDRATALFESFTGRNLMARDYSYDSSSDDYDADNAILDGNGFDQIILPQYPINSVTTLRINEIEIDARDGIYSLGYVVDAKAGIIRLAGYLFSEGWGNVELEYNAGYSAVPKDLEQAVIEQAAWMHKQSGEGGSLLGVTSVTIADDPVAFMLKDLLPSVKMALERYKKRFAL
jgi:uncharacterized phiE125 gp8 family phage protein